MGGGGGGGLVIASHRPPSFGIAPSSLHSAGTCRLDSTCFTGAGNKMPIHFSERTVP